MKVENMRSPNGYKVPNQFIITTTEISSINGVEVERTAVYFQSYETIIAKLIRKLSSWQVYLDKNYWDYSVTTGKYRNIFLGETKRETEKKIKSGEYILANLN